MSVVLPQRFTYPSPGFKHYWAEETGKALLEKPGRVPEQHEVEQAAQWLMEADTMADHVIEQVYKQRGFKAAQELVETALKNGIAKVPDAPQSLVRLFNEIETIPAWLDYDLLHAGAEFCRRTSSLALVVLRNYCLMGGYESSAINKPLIYTGALKHGAAKRMAETVEFWVNVIGPGALKPGAIGYNSCVKVRLMHAYARVTVKEMPAWSNEKWGLPINHGDMVATNLGFSIVFLTGLRKLGFRPTEREVNGLFHLWKYIGYLIGIPPGYLPGNEKEAIIALYNWTISQPEADNDTVALAQALMYEPLYASFPKLGVNKRILMQLHLAYNHYFLGERACGIMKLPQTRIKFYPYIAAGLNRFTEWLVPKSGLLYRLSAWIGYRQQVLIKNLFLRIHHNAH